MNKEEKEMRAIMVQLEKELAEIFSRSWLAMYSINDVAREYGCEIGEVIK